MLDEYDMSRDWSIMTTSQINALSKIFVKINTSCIQTQRWIKLIQGLTKLKKALKN